ncbi:MAG: SPOR domain-containing protein [Bacteroidales bacterium]
MAAEHDRLITLALEKEALSDSLSRVIMARKQELARERGVEKRKSLQQKVDSLELQQIRYQQQADALFQQACGLEQEALFLPEDVPAGYGQNLSPGSWQDTARFPDYTSDLFYREDPFRKLFRRNELNRLDEWVALEQTGNEYMSKAREAERKAAEWRVRADGAGNQSQMRRFLNRAGKEDEKALEYKMMAVEVYQVVNENKYLLLNDVLDRLNDTAEEGALTGRITLYCERAREQYAHAQTLRQAAIEQMNQEQKYQGLVEANAYELVTLENQKRAFETAAGIRRPDPGSVILITGTSADSRNRLYGTADDHAGAPGELHDARPVAAWSEGTGDGTDTKGGEISEPGRKETDAGRLEYKIQVGVFSSPLHEEYFRGYTPVTREAVPGTELIRYYVGKYGSYDEAQQALGRVRENLSDQAFLVATLNGNRIALPRARSLEGWGQKAREEISGGTVKERTEGAIPVFKVQVGAFRGMLPPDAENHYREASGGAQVEKRTDEQGLTVYTIGNFYTFDEAVRFRSRLAANGLTDAFVTAYLEGRRIGVERARSMTNE